MSLGRQTYTERGFPLLSFTDSYGLPCSLQASSMAERPVAGTSAVWLGVDAGTRMHLRRDKVVALVAHLQAWLGSEEGSFEVSPPGSIQVRRAVQTKEMKSGAFVDRHGDIYLRVVSIDTESEGWPMRAVDHGLSIEEAHCIMAELMAAIHESCLRKSGRANIQEGGE